MGTDTARRLTMFFWLQCMKSAAMSRAQRSAVSPVEMGAATTPSMASIPPNAPSHSIDMLCTSPPVPPFSARNSQDQLSHPCPVKHRTGKLLVFEASCHHGRLCGMESRYRATGYRHKHHREQGHRVGIGRAVIEALRHSVGYRDITKEENAHYSCSHEE